MIILIKAAGLIAMTGITVRMDIKKSGLKNAWII
jgi:hypothetical protein